jgi:hypothetical protein
MNFCYLFSDCDPIYYRASEEFKFIGKVAIAHFGPNENIQFIGVTGGADQSAITLDTDGSLYFNELKDYENVDDANSDHFYEIVVTLTGKYTFTCALEIELVNGNRHEFVCTACNKEFG